MKILVVGGGSGGHVTPAVAVIREIWQLQPRAKVEFWTDRKYYVNVSKLMVEMGSSNQVRVRKVVAGKFRRYRNLKFSQYFCDGAKVLRDLTIGNLVGFLRFGFGTVQSLVRLVRKKNRPDVVFLKGGYVGLPVGVVAKMLKIPYVIHESDARPGLTNRILMDKAAVVATGVEMSDKGEKYEWVGVPVGAEFKKVSETTKKSLKRSLGFDPEKPLVMITGGSQGSEHINTAVAQILPEMLKSTAVGLIAGRKHYEEMVELKKYEVWEGARLKTNFRMWSFSAKMYELLGAADVVVSRAGATTIAELAALAKAVILVPFEKLPGDHQTKNAVRMEKSGAVMMVGDAKVVKKPEELLEMVRKLVRSPKLREELAENLHRQSRTDAARRLAEILIRVAKNEAG